MKKLYLYIFGLMVCLFFAYIYYNLIDTSYRIDDWDDDYTSLMHVDGSVVIGPLVADYERKGMYLLLLRIPAISKDCVSDDGKLMISTFYSRDFEYFIIDLKSDEKEGPYNESDFKNALISKKISSPALKAPNYYYTDGSFSAWNEVCLYGHTAH